MSDKRAGRGRLRRVAVGLSGLAVLAAFIWFVHTMMDSKKNKTERQVQVVQIIKPPPPPPPDTPPPPPPEKTDEPLPKDEPEPTPQEQDAPHQQLGLDAEGAAGGDAFGLAARKGGSDLVGGSGNAAFAWYTNRLKDAVVERLSADTKLGAKKFSVSVRLWIEPDGRIREVKLVSTTGDAELDRQIEAALASMAKMGDAPPLEMPQPVTMKIVSRK